MKCVAQIIDLPQTICGGYTYRVAEHSQDPAAQQILPLVEYIARVARRAYDNCQEPGCLRPRHLNALDLMYERGPLSQHALGEALSLDPSNVVGLLNELEERGLIVRERDPADRRRHIVSLAPSGKAELATAGSQLASVEDDLLRALSADERAVLRDLLMRVARGTPPPGCAQASC
jgi:DNA-binding MarR family transcriptional regulator